MGVTRVLTKNGEGIMTTWIERGNYFIHTIWDLNGSGKNYYGFAHLACFVFHSYDENLVRKYVDYLFSVNPKCPYLIITRSKPPDNTNHPCMYLPHDGFINLKIIRENLVAFYEPR